MRFFVCLLPKIIHGSSSTILCLNSFMIIPRNEKDGPGQEALRSIFFPRDHERKAVLLKRGPILLNGVQECELMLFTNGFLLREIKVDSLLKNVFAMNLDEAQSLTSEQLHERFDDIDSDGNGCEF